MGCLLKPLLSADSKESLGLPPEGVKQGLLANIVLWEDIFIYTNKELYKKVMPCISHFGESVSDSLGPIVVIFKQGTQEHCYNLRDAR